MEFGATSHFFPPRLQLVVEKKKNPNRFPPYFRNQLAFDRLFGHQPNGPARPARWRLTADHRDEALTLFVWQQSLCARSLPILQGPLQTGILVTPSHLRYGFGREPDMGRHLGNGFAIVQRTHSQSPSKTRTGWNASTQKAIQFLTIAFCQTYTKASIDSHALPYAVTPPSVIALQLLLQAVRG
jgi:hypothetical protein